MHNNQKLLEAKRNKIFKYLSNMKNILPGSFSIRKLTCGKPNCICKREKKLHDAFHLSCRIDNKAVAKMIPRTFVDQVQKQVLMNKEFKKLLNQIYKINMQILLDQIESAKIEK